MVQTAETGSKHIKNYFFGFLYLSGFYLFLNTLFFLISLMTDLDILCSDSHNFLKEINKKITKETNKKFFYLLCPQVDQMRKQTKDPHRTPHLSSNKT